MISPATWPSRLLKHRLERLGIVEGHDVGQLAERPRIAGAIRDRARFVALPNLVQPWVDRDHHRVVVAVVGPLDLEDQIATGGAPREMDRGHGRLGAGVDKAPLGKAEAVRELLGDHDRAVGGGGEVGAEVDPRLHRRAHCRVGVTDAHDAEAVVKVDVLVSVHVPDAGARAPLHVDGPGVVLLKRGGNAVRHHLHGTLVALLGGWRALAQLCHLALGQRGDARAVDRGGAGRGRLDGHPLSLVGICGGVARVPAASGGLRTRCALAVGRIGVSLSSGR